MSDVFDDLTALQVDPADTRPHHRSKGWQRKFIMVPWLWVERLQSAKRTSTYRLALVLIYESWRAGGRPVALSNVFARTGGVSPRSKWNALAELEGLGLVQVERRRGRAPRVAVRGTGRGQT
jgi:hypothetical protein